MQDITQVFLENELDVILAHKRSARLAELAGLSMSGQTTFATAVSEVARSAMDNSNTALLVLCVESNGINTPRFIVAHIRDISRNIDSSRRAEGLSYAKRLVSNVKANEEGEDNSIELRFRIPSGQAVNGETIKRWVLHFENELPTSPYEEIKRKNRQLVELAERLRTSEQQYRELSETLPLLIFTWHQEKGLTYINKWTRDYTGLGIADMAGQRGRDVIHPSEYDELMEAWEKARATATPLTHQLRLKNGGTGEYLWHLHMLLPQKNELDQVITWIGFGVDIHAQKMIEETLKDNKELKYVQQMLVAKQEELEANLLELNQSNEDLERFAFIASHDLQEPLRKIMTYSDLLATRFAPLLDDEGRKIFTSMVNASHHMKLLIRDVLAYSTLARAAAEPECVDLFKVVNEALKDLEGLVNEKQGHVVVGLLPEVMGNPYQLRQLFVNLISNSLKYAKDGVPPRISIHHNALPDGHTEIIFTDNGIGFENEYAEKIFQLFQRLHGRGHYSGTGIGLAICKRVMELHGGTITASGRPGEGAEFHISLPQ